MKIEEVLKPGEYLLYTSTEIKGLNKPLKGYRVTKTKYKVGESILNKDGSISVITKIKTRSVE